MSDTPGGAAALPSRGARLTARDVLANGEFRAFLAANTLFHLCASSLTVMLAFHIYQLRENPLDIAALGAVQVIPALTIAFHAGDVADRRPRKGLLVGAVAGLAALTGALSLASAGGHVTVALVLAVGFLAATLRAYENPANIGLEAEVVPRAHILKALPIVSTASRIADMGGPVLMGLVWAWGGPEACYGLMAAVLSVSALILASRVAARPAPVPPDRLPPMRRVREGLAYVWHSPILLGSMALDLFAVFFGGAAALLPIFASDILDAGPEGFGLLRSAIAAGTLTAAVVSIRYMPAVRAGLVLHLIVVGFGLSMIGFALSTSFWLSMAMLFLAGICDGFSMVIRHAILRLASPEHMRGRIAAVRMVFIASSNELGAVQSGTMASLIGPVRAVVAGGTLTVLVAAVVARRVPALLHLDLLTFETGEARRRP